MSKYFFLNVRDIYVPAYLPFYEIILYMLAYFSSHAMCELYMITFPLVGGYIKSVFLDF
jgi:hypothetical protein